MASGLAALILAGPAAAVQAPTTTCHQTEVSEVCFHLTGYGTNESSLRIAANGDVLMYPAFSPDGPALLRSRDDGRSWTTQVPDSGKREEALGRVQPFMYLEPETGRIFAFSSQLQPVPTALGNGQVPGRGMRMQASSDGGRTWRYSLVGPDGLDWIKMLSGPPVTSQTKGFPKVLYLSLPTPISTPLTVGVTSVELPDKQAFYRSLDGGDTWERVGSLSLKTKDVPGCPQTEFILYNNGVVGREGTIHLGLRRCANLAVATSRDEGHTWTVADVPGAKLSSITSLADAQQKPEWLQSEPLAIDQKGNLHATWTGADHLLHIATSRDGGRTWSAPTVISAPGVDYVTLSASDAGARKGQLAVSYYGSSDGGDTYDAYVAETRNALAGHPAFTSIRVNDPKEPLYRNDDVNRLAGQQAFDPGYISLITTGSTVGLGDMNEFLQVRYAPDGSIWSSFSQRMCPGFNYVNCGWDLTQNENAVFQLAAAHVTRLAKPGLGLPSTRRCASRRNFLIHLRRGLRSAKVVVNGKRVHVLHGKRLRARVNLRGLPKGTVKVRIDAVTRGGRRVSATRTYRTCAKTR